MKAVRETKGVLSRNNNLYREIEESLDIKWWEQEIKKSEEDSLFPTNIERNVEGYYKLEGHNEN